MINKHSTDDARILDQRPLIPPAILIEEVPVSKTSAAFINEVRSDVNDVIQGRDKRLIVVVGPCSIHDVEAASEYATKLKPLAEKYADDLIVIMRVYFEKPRTVVGWKGFINDPLIDGSFQINKGLRGARKLLSEISDMKLACASEFLDTIIPQFTADFISWAAIGARTTESQVHRELASGLSMAIGFKNGTDGNVQIAIDAIRAARHTHWFPSVTKQGVSAIFCTKGNDSCHIILRGGKTPNYTAQHVAAAVESLKKANLPANLFIDCSHGNSNKDYRNQPLVADNICEQLTAGSTAISGVMIESHLVEGRQDFKAGVKSVYGQSITDACVSFKQTVPILEKLAKASRVRRKK